MRVHSKIASSLPKKSVPEVGAFFAHTGQARMIVSIVLFIEVTAMTYKDFKHKVPWMTEELLAVILVIGVVLLYLFVYCIADPSIKGYNQRRLDREGWSPLHNRVQNIENKLSDIEGKLEEIK